jgi:hypothetical protein
MVGTLAISAIGARSLCGSNPSLRYSEAEARHQQRVAVGLRADSGEGAHIGVGAGPVDRDKGLSEPLAETVA